MSSEDMDVVDTDAADVLDAAADQIRIHGWCRGVLSIGDRVCLIGALNRTVESGNSMWLARSAVCKVIGKERFYPLGDWNDKPGRTADEVITVLMETAARVRTREVKL